MSLSLILACLWCILANVVGMLPSKHKHWPSAYVLIAIGLPLLVFVVRENGMLIGTVVLMAAMSILRWPVRYLVRWIRALVARPA